MKQYQVVNAAFQPVPVLPFNTERDAVAYVRSLQETYNEAFSVIELNVVSALPRPRIG